LSSDTSGETTSRVEAFFLARSGKPLRFAPTEKTGVIEVEDFPALGRLTALRFLEWVLENPEGVISLPTGKTPEYFIKWTCRFLDQWNDPGVRRLREEAGLTAAARPDLRGLRFIQIDEFYPIDPSQHNSFHYYVTREYIQGFGLDPARALLIDPTAIGLPPGQTLETVFPGGAVDLTLRSRHARTNLERTQRRVLMGVDQFCSEYEARIRALGGIGFFLGGIGPDGHIGFNARGSLLHSPTRLTLTNYETEAAAAGDLGGIEVSRGKPVITIGLGTITHNPDAVAIIFAAGEAKARIVADAIERDPHVEFPATALQALPHARFYLTRGAASRLIERRIHHVRAAVAVPDEIVERAVIDRALAQDRRLDQLRAGDENGDRVLQAIIERTGRPLSELAARARAHILEKIERGMRALDNQTILHTGPHHDDIMLGYMPCVMHLVRTAANRNHFAVLTSGFTAVTNHFLASILEDLSFRLARGEFDRDREEGAFEPDRAAARAAEVYRYLDGIAASDEALRLRAQARRMLFNAMQVYDEGDFALLRGRIEETLHYLRTQYPGRKDPPVVQALKGRQREYEEELIWGYAGAIPSDVSHLRLGFYTGDLFTPTPTAERDVAPLLDLMNRLQPTLVTVALDPEGAGPDTHYKALQIVHEALHRHREATGRSPVIWGYRNVWHRFHPAEANVFVPASLNMMAVMRHAFEHCFGSQRAASFPSPDHDGPFSELAQKIWVEQHAMARVCLGERFFVEHPHPWLRAARGFVFLKEMTLDQFSGAARSLARAAEGLAP